LWSEGYHYLYRHLASQLGFPNIPVGRKSGLGEYFGYLPLLWGESDISVREVFFRKTENHKVAPCRHG